MTTIKEVEELVQASYGGFGYEVSRVTGKSLIVTLPQAGQNLDDLMVDLRARGCSIDFDTLADESPPKVELTVHPGVHTRVYDEDDVLDPPYSRPRLSDGDDEYRGRARAKSGCPLAGWICVGAAMLITLLFLFAAWQKVAAQQGAGVKQ